MKSTVVPIAVVLIIVSVFLIYNSTQTVSNIRQTLDVERYQRITTEEKLQQAETRIRILESQISNSREKLNEIQTILEEQESAAEEAEEKDSVDQGTAASDEQLKEFERTQPASPETQPLNL